MAKDKDKPEYDPKNPLAWRKASLEADGKDPRTHVHTEGRPATLATGEPTNAEIAEAETLRRLPALQHPAQLPRDAADNPELRTQRDRDDLADDTSNARKAELAKQQDRKAEDRVLHAAATDTAVVEVVDANKAAAKTKAKADKKKDGDK